MQLAGLIARTLEAYADDGSTAVEVLEGKVDVKPCGAGKPITATPGQVYRVFATCGTDPVNTRQLTSQGSRHH
jgi:hypothetical protein